MNRIGRLVVGVILTVVPIYLSNDDNNGSGSLGNLEDSQFGKLVQGSYSCIIICLQKFS